MTRPGSRRRAADGSARTRPRRTRAGARRRSSRRPANPSRAPPTPRGHEQSRRSNRGRPQHGGQRRRHDPPGLAEPAASRHADRDRTCHSRPERRLQRRGWAATPNPGHGRTVRSACRNTAPIPIPMRDEAIRAGPQWYGCGTAELQSPAPARCDLNPKFRMPIPMTAIRARRGIRQDRRRPHPRPQRGHLPRRGPHRQEGLAPARGPGARRRPARHPLHGGRRDGRRRRRRGRQRDGHRPHLPPLLHRLDQRRRRHGPALRLPDEGSGRGGQPADPPVRHDHPEVRGMGTTLTAAGVFGGDALPDPDRRQPRLPDPPGASHPDHQGPVADAAPGRRRRADRGRGGGERAAQHHPPGAGPRSAGAGGPHPPARSAGATCWCSAPTASRGQVKKDEIAAASPTRTPTWWRLCKALIDLANERGGPDNITCIAARFDGEGLPAPDGEEAIGHQVYPLQERESTTEPVPVYRPDDDSSKRATETVSGPIRPPPRRIPHRRRSPRRSGGHSRPPLAGEAPTREM